MSKDENLLDDFNVEEPVKKTSKAPVSPWEEEKEENTEAICVVCDALFTPLANRPPILCPACKAGLLFILDK